MEQTGTWEEWIPILEQGIARSRAQQDLETQAELHIFLGNLRRMLGEYDQASLLLQRAAEYFRLLDLPLRRAVALSRQANVARTQRDYAKAKHLIDVALTRLPDDDPECPYCYFVKGAIAIECLELAAAISALEQAKELALSSDNQRVRALALLNLGRVYELQKDYDRSIDLYQQAIAIFETNQDPVNLAVAHMNLGIAYMHPGEPEKALRHYQSADATLRKLGDRRYLAMVYNNLGMLYRDLEQWTDAEEAFHAGIAIWHQRSDTLSRLNIEGNLGIAYLRGGKISQAIQTLESIFSELEEIDPDMAEREKLYQGLRPYLQEAYDLSGVERTPGVEI